MKYTLKSVRVNAGYSQGAIASLLGVSKSTVSRWERGDTPIPSSILDRYCTICGVTKNQIKLGNQKEGKSK